MKAKSINIILAAAVLFSQSLLSCNKELSSNMIDKSALNNQAIQTTFASAATFASVIKGSVLREEWDNITGNDVVNIPLTATADKSGPASSLQGPLNYTDDYGDRLRGYVYPPSNGKYTFWVAGDDAAELWLSTDESPDHKVKIASTLSWTNFKEWNKFTSQKSTSVTLQSSKRYYIEVLHKQGRGGDNLSVQWMLPNKSVESPIPGSRLSPYIAPVVQVENESAAISLDGAHDITIDNKTITGGKAAAITLTNCYNIHITRNRLINSSEVGIYLYKCKNITIDYNYFTNVSTGVYADQSAEGGISVKYNEFLNMQGPFPRGQFVQFNNVNGANNEISSNKGENILGKSYPEDAISLYQSHGTSSSPIRITGNWIRGGGPSASGGGIMLGDNGGSYLIASDNILVNPGEFGMAIAGGDHNSMINNSVYAVSQYFTNVGIYVNSINGYRVTDCTVSGNKIRYFNKDNYMNNAWLAPGTDAPAGWNNDNIFGADINANILPDIIITKK